MIKSLNSGVDDAELARMFDNSAPYMNLLYPQSKSIWDGTITTQEFDKDKFKDLAEKAKEDFILYLTLCEVCIRWLREVEDTPSIVVDQLRYMLNPKFTFFTRTV